jgi:putative Mg2+ transporter-C (MgtC) family protein
MPRDRAPQPCVGASMDMADMLLRLGLATGAALLLGLDRELRGIAAGMRTHALVGLSAAVITLSALLLADELRRAGDADIDPLRAIQGLAQAIGFIAAGAIFVARGDVHNLTSAATLWLAAALGIAAGAGQIELTLAAFAIGGLVLTVLRPLERRLPRRKLSDDD